MMWFQVIARELRSEARQPYAYWTRVGAAGIALIIGGIWTLDKGSWDWSGAEVFEIVQPTLFSLIWLAGPVLTCDSISRERREGTLGLLLLTRLQPGDIGLAKACSGMVRALTMVLAVLPMLSISLLLGGVSGADLLRAGLMDVMALLGAVGAGLLASSRCRNFSRAALLALIYAALTLLFLGSLQTFFYIMNHRLSHAEDWLAVMLAGPWVLCAGFPSVWRYTGGVSTTVYLWLSAGQVLLAGLFVCLVLRGLNRNLRAVATETGRSARQEWWWRVFCTPRWFTGWLKRRQQWLLNRNPIGWLQRRTWSARLSTWGWLGVVTVAESAMVLGGGGSLSDIRDLQLWLGGLVAVGLAFSAADSFRGERETGALELLLVAPLKVRQIITGRLFGLWGQYVLVFGLLVGLWWYASGWHGPAWGRGWMGLANELGQARGLMFLVFLSTFMLLPVIGLHQSMVRKHFISSWLLTITLGLIIPLLLPGSLFYGMLLLWFGLNWGWGIVLTPTLFVVVGISLQALLAAWAAHRLHRNLSRRLFATR